MTDADEPDRAALTLFDDSPRTETRFAHRAEPHFTFMNISARSGFDRVRATLDSWYCKLPEDDLAELRRRFRSPGDSHHLGAFFELYLHEVFHRLGYQLEPHPEVPGTRNRPDFLVSEDNEKFYLEGTLVADALLDAGAKKRRAMVLDSLGKLETSAFTLDVEIWEEGDGQPSAGALRARLERWLGTLDVEQVKADYEREGDDGLPSYPWTDRGWAYTFRALPVGLSGASSVVSGIQTGGVRTLNDYRGISRNLKDKAKQLRSVEHPCIVAVLVRSDLVQEQDVGQALFGHFQRSVSLDGGLWFHQRQVPDGVWRGPSGPQNRHLTGVLVAQGLIPWYVGKVEPVLWLNPWARLPLVGAFPFAKVEVDPCAGPRLPREFVSV